MTWFRAVSETDGGLAEPRGLAALGLWRALGASGAGVFIRLYAGATSLALLAFSLWAASIGWVGAQTWTM